MGVVYRAEDLKLGRQVALKLLPLPASEAGPQMLDSFRREARAASVLNHPNICTIYGVEEFAGQPVIVMEQLEGETLAERLARGPLPLGKTIPLAIQMAGALAEAHGRGVVHRDLKPANIMLTKSGVKLLDFGLAITEGSATLREEAALQAGTILGSFHYMSPEQVQGTEVDGRSDIFSFGCILLEMLTGERAFRGDTAAEVMTSTLTKDPLECVIDRLSPAARRILRHCLEKKPDDRFQSARDLVFDLEALSDESSVSTASAIIPAKNRLRRTAAASIVALVALAGTWWIGRLARSPEPVKFERLTFRRGVIQSARFTPDGRTIVYSASWDGQPLDLFSIQIGNLESRPLGFASTGLLAIAATGEMAVSTNCRIAPFNSVGTLGQMPLAGGAPREILENVLFADWTLDGRRLAITVGQDKGRPGRLEFPIGHVLVEAKGTGWPGDPRISPAGDLIAFADHYYRGDDGSIAVVDLQGRKKTLTRTFDTLQGLAWSPRGTEIWFTADTEGRNRSLYSVTLSGAMRVVARLPGNLKLHDIAADGRLLLTREDIRSNVYFLGPGDSIPHDLTWLNWAVSPYLSADGKTLLMWDGGKRMTYIRGTDGSPPVGISRDRTGVSLSPDGQWVATTKGPSKQADITLLPVKAGSPVPIETGSLDLSGYRGVPDVTWFPDSKRILFSAREPGREIRTFVQDIHGGQPHPLTPEGISGSALTPDGASLLVFDSRSNAFLFPIQGGTPKPLPFVTPEYRALGFSMDGRWLYFVKGSENPPKIWQADLGTGRIGVFREIPVSDRAGIVSLQTVRITPDGKSLAYSLIRYLSELYIVDGLR
jgi:serine/threonine protein kinase/dipeptidyl aminopeptidase/acylaminoacyl peptidase